ncbi:MAG: sigma-70 family RNA polymerase sigma factor [Planctomyces sp.]|nr:sigma-70 family RNA polymerase sigma factor [Planctomyces sp.]
MADDLSELVQRCLAGEPDAQRNFVDQFQQRVFALCYRMLGHRQDAEDAAQESLARAVRHLGRWQSDRPLDPWVLAIAANRCRTALEKRSRRPVTAESLPEPACLDSRTGSELAEELQRAVDQLRPNYRETFILFYQQELSCEEIGQMLGAPDGTIKTWLHRARKELAELLRQRGITPEQNDELHTVARTTRGAD